MKGALSLIYALLVPSGLETCGICLFNFSLCVFLLSSEHFLEIATILSLWGKGSLWEGERIWIENLFFHGKMGLLSLLFLMDTIVCAGLCALLLRFAGSDRPELWFVFFLNLLTLKGAIELLGSFHLSKTSLRGLSCVAFTPWFIILKSGLESPGNAEYWILLGAWCFLLSGLQIFGEVLLRWATVSCEWSEGCSE